jgi:integrase
LGGKISDERLTSGSFARVVKLYIERIGGLDPAVFSGHSLRSGFLTSSAESGTSLIRLADHSRHTSLDTLRGYVRRVDMWKNHPGHHIL